MQSDHEDSDRFCELAVRELFSEVELERFTDRGLPLDAV